MRKSDLYQLPTLGQSQGKAAVRRILGVYLLVMTVFTWILGQAVAHHLRYIDLLGKPLVVLPRESSGLLVAFAAIAMVAAIVALSQPRWRRFAIPNAMIAGMTVVLSFGPLYAPWDLLVWIQRFESAQLERSAMLLQVIAALGGCVACVAVLIALGKGRDKPDVHGSAHWATHGEIQDAGLLADEGLLIGLHEHGSSTRYLRHDGPEHVFVFAPTRTGKGVGLVLPNLLTWPHSVLVHDIKGENWNLSAGWRHHELGSRCLRFDPTDATGEGARYNPLGAIRLGPQEVRDAQNVADILVDPNGDRVRDHWDRTAHSLLVGVILHVLHAEGDKTLHGCVNFLTNPEVPFEDTLEQMLTARHNSTGTHPLVAGVARSILDKSANERSGVLSTALSFLELYRDPIVAANTAVSDFTIDDLVNDDRPVSLYLTVPPSDLHRTRPLVRMILNQALRRLTESMRFEDGRALGAGRHPLLLMLDEFPALGRLAFFQESLAYLAGYGIRAFLITQDLSQHYGVYGREESITGNCHVRIAFTANKPETAELISRMAGDMTVHLEQRSWQGSGFGAKSTISTQQTGRRLLTADEAMRLPEDDALIFVAGQPPIRGSKIRYYLDRELSRRSGFSTPGSDK